MYIKEPTFYSDIRRFLEANLDKFPEEQRYIVQKLSPLWLAKWIWNENFRLVKKYGFNSLFFFHANEKNAGLSFAYEIFPQVVEICSIACQGYAKTHYQGINFFLSHLENYDFWVRAQCFVYEKNKFYGKLLNKFGFKEEGFVEKYDGRYNYILMAKVR